MRSSQLGRSVEEQIRDVVDAWADGTRARDSSRVLALYASDAVNFDIAPPLRLRGAEARDPKVLEDWFATWRGPIGVEHRDLQVTTSGALALVHGLMHLTGSRTTGEETDVWIRHTLGLLREGGAWRIVHEHTSVPMHMDGSSRAAIDLEP